MRLSCMFVVASLAPAVFLTGCGDIFSIDNYDEPNAILSGHVVYQGEPVGVRSGGLELELWQPGFDFEEKIPVHIAQDGSFSANVFAGDYEINLMSNSPWVDNTQRIPVEVSGTTTLDLPVTPYYVIQNETVQNVGGTVQASFSIGEVNTSRALERVGVFVGTTQFVDPTNQVVNTQVLEADIADRNNVTVSVTLPNDIHLTPSPEPRTKVFVRVGVKTVGISEWLFTQLHEVDL